MNSNKHLLYGLRVQGQLSDLDVHFATLMGKLSNDESQALLLAAALASHVSSMGHVCLSLAEWSDQLVGDAEMGEALQLPSLGEWREQLIQYQVIGRPGERTPLILDHADRLYLHRYWAYEQQLARGLLELSQAEMITPDLSLLQPMLTQLFPVQEEGKTNWQKIAAAVSVMKRLTVISGGPGTGKTSTVVRILALLLQQAGDEPLSIALAAPTGKAAARLQASIQQAINQLSLEAPLLEKIPHQAMTLHRLMGSRRDSILFRHSAENPLPCDLLIIDEASMVDVALMAKVIAALPAQGRLILLGDRHQLASVEAGAVLGDICSEGRGFSEPFHVQLGSVVGEEISDVTPSQGVLSDSIVELTHSYRFDQNSGIGQLAGAVNRGDAVAALSLLEDARFTDIHLLKRTDDPIAVALSHYSDYLSRVKQGAPIEAIFAAYEKFRVLCVLRLGEQGVSGLNEAIYEGLVAAHLIPRADTWYPGRPLLITHNDHNLRLYNGDIGILLQDQAGQKSVYFQTPDGYRTVSPSRLPRHETAFALTVHKSQGSEFESVLFILPANDNPLLSRELIYTGLTRSRTQLLLCDQAGVLTTALNQRIKRTSGLKDLLWQGSR